MPNRTYTTTQGDTWDLISLRVYGTELLTNRLFEANTEYREVLEFGAGTVLVVPEVTPEETQSTNLPPWRRGS